MYYTYMIRCRNNSIYTGITTDLNRRFSEHKEKGEKGAKYTHTNEVVEFVAAWKSQDRVSATKLEYWIKRLNKSQKEELVQDNSTFDNLLGKKLESINYERILF